MGHDEPYERIDLPRPSEPPADSKISVEDRLTEPIGVHLVEAERTVLFGTGYAASADRLRRELPTAPDAVVVEHGDPDHYGAVPALRAAYDDLTVFAPLGDRDRFEGTDVDVDVFLSGGDTVGGFEAIHVPGHTPGNMSFVHPGLGILIVGDSFVAADSEIAATGEWSGAFAPLAPEWDTDFELLCASLPALAERSFHTALLTHGSDRVGDAADEVHALLADVVDGG